MESGGRVIQEPECQNKSLTKKKRKKKAKISLAYFSPILRILVDPGRADGPMLTPNPKKLRIGGAGGVCQISNLKSKK